MVTMVSRGESWPNRLANETLGTADSLVGFARDRPRARVEPRR
jgi:hypothetical protein